LGIYNLIISSFVSIKFDKIIKNYDIMKRRAMALNPLLESEIKLKIPKLYKVILLNDDYTTFDFVIEVLKTIFYKSEEEAINLTLKVDREGSAIIGVYPYEIAQMKVDKLHKVARDAGYPLRAILEEV